MIIIDADGAERDWEWVKVKYNLPDIARAPKDKDHWEVVELHENCRDSSMTVRTLEDGEPCGFLFVRINWPDGEVEQETTEEGYTGFGLGIGSYYRPPDIGPHCVWIPYASSDKVCGLGMLGKRDHWHLEPTFQFVKGEGSSPSPPPPDCEEYIAALEKIREIVKAFPPLVD